MKRRADGRSRSWGRRARGCGRMLVALGSWVIASGVASCKETDNVACEQRLQSLADHQVEVLSGAGDERLSCGELAPADAAALSAVETRLRALPPAAREVVGPFRLRMWRAPGARVGEPHVAAATGDLIVDPRSPAVADLTIWLHELAHVAIHAPLRAERRGGGREAAPLWRERLQAAIEEGVADYFAACAGSTTRLGAIDGREPRDLAEAPVDEPASAAAWETLPFPGADFEPHRLGASLASLAFRDHGVDLDLALVAVRSVRQVDGTKANSPRALVYEIAQRGAPRAPELHLLFQRWLPPPLRSQEPTP
jgi:hypothetical protein